MTAPGKAGQQSIFEEVVRQRGLIRRVLRRNSPVSELDDLVQECMLRAWRRITEGAYCPRDPTTPLADVPGWVTGIARWVAIDAQRARVIQTLVLPREFAHCERIASLEEQLTARDELRAAEQVRLSRAQRETITLYSQGYTAGEISRAMMVSVDTVFTWLRRARTLLTAAQKREAAKLRF